MEFSTRWLEQMAKLLAEEVKEQMAEKQGINEAEAILAMTCGVRYNLSGGTP